MLPVGLPPKESLRRLPTSRPVESALTNDHVVGFQFDRVARNANAVARRRVARDGDLGRTDADASST